MRYAPQGDAYVRLYDGVPYPKWQQEADHLVVDRSDTVEIQDMADVWWLLTCKNPLPSKCVSEAHSIHLSRWRHKSQEDEWVIGVSVLDAEGRAMILGMSLLGSASVTRYNNVLEAIRKGELCKKSYTWY